MTIDALVKTERRVLQMLNEWSEAAHKPVTLQGLLNQWSRVVDRTESGYDLSLDDYLNDLDSRVLLDHLLAESGPAFGTLLRDQLAPLDTRFIVASEPSVLLRTTNNWRSRVPLKMGHEMRAQLQDLERAQRCRQA